MVRSPQWQIDALWRFQIPEELRRKYGYPQLTRDAKRKILGLNSASLYGVKPLEAAEKDKVYRPVPKDYEKRMSNELKTMLEFPWLQGGQYDQAQRKIPRDGTGAEQHTVRLDANYAVVILQGVDSDIPRVL